VRPHVSRRHFLKTATALAVPTIIPATAIGDGRASPSDRITMAMIGLGSMGLRHVQGFVQETDCQITHCCDVDASRARAAAKVADEAYKAQGCKEVRDFRDLLADDGIDTLVIAIPDHWHAACAIPCIRSGKAIYGEKPLSLTVREGRAMVEAVRRYGIVWQMGSWQRSTAHFRFGVELVRNGRIGRLQRVEVGLAQGTPCPPQPPMPVPEGFDYDLWLGPAPWEPYTEKRCHWNFRWILAYSGGQVTDDGAHQIDIAHWGMGADGTGPVAVEGKGDFPAEGLWDAATTFQFRCAYANGVVMDVASSNIIRGGIKWIGDRGWVYVRRGNVIEAEPKSLLKETIGPGEIHLASPAEGHRQGHRRNFLDCVRTHARPITPIEIGHNSINVAHLGNIAMRLGRRIRWDPAREIIPDDPEANRMLWRPMREPWRI